MTPYGGTSPQSIEVISGPISYKISAFNISYLNGQNLVTIHDELSLIRVGKTPGKCDKKQHDIDGFSAILW